MFKRADFPFFTIYPSAHYLDSAATSLVSEQVIKALVYWYREIHAPIGRSIYQQAENVTQLYEAARASVAQFIGARSHEIVFVRGATEGINYVAQGWARSNLKSSDEIILTVLEHHASWVVWHELAHECGFTIRVVPLETGQPVLNYNQYEALLSCKTKLVVAPHISNVLGGVIDINRIVAGAHAVGAAVLCDAAQSIAHLPINLAELGVDFLVFSAHKMGGPEGIGVLYCAERFHDQIRAVQYGGGMVQAVSAKTEFREMPYRLEAGTPHGAGAYGLQAAIDYMQSINRSVLIRDEIALVKKVYSELSSIPGVHVVSDPAAHAMVTWVVDAVHPHDVAALLGQNRLLVRAGFHCAQPLHESLGLTTGSIRASFSGLYTTEDDCESLVSVIKKI